MQFHRTPTTTSPRPRKRGRRLLAAAGAAGQLTWRVAVEDAAGNQSVVEGPALTVLA